MFSFLSFFLLFAFFFFFFFNDTATTEIYTLSLHDALPIYRRPGHVRRWLPGLSGPGGRSEEHTSELQSRQYLVCRLMLEKKKQNNKRIKNKKNKSKRLTYIKTSINN